MWRIDQRFPGVRDGACACAVGQTVLPQPLCILTASSYVNKNGSELLALGAKVNFLALMFEDNYGRCNHPWRQHEGYTGTFPSPLQLPVNLQLFINDK